MARKEVLWLAERMEKKLAANDHKGGWRGKDITSLFYSLTTEVNELFDAIRNNKPSNEIVDECADVANFAMMIADEVREQSRTPLVRAVDRFLESHDNDAHCSIYGELEDAILNLRAVRNEMPL